MLFRSRAGFKTVHDTAGSNAVCKKFRIDSDVRTSINDHRTSAKMTTKEVALGTIDVSFEGTIEWSINRKSRLIKLVAKSMTQASHGEITCESA